jgi:hypothetical protein
MPLFSSRPRADGIEGPLQKIRLGDCDDQTIRQLQTLIEGMSDDDVRSLADTLMANLVKYPDNIDVLAGSVRALEALPYLPKAKNEFIITLLVSLLKAPVNKKDALQSKTLKSEIIKFLLYFIVEDDSYARLMMPELISALDDTYGTISSSVYHALQRLATEKPEYFESHSAALIKQLGSINKSTRASSAKVIGLIAKSHPEYVSRAMPFLQSLASFYPDAQVKRNASEAFQIISRSMKQEAPVTVASLNEDAEGKGFAEIVKLNAGKPGDAAGVKFTDEELKDIIELTRNEFKSDAEAILNSLGVGHLTAKGRESRKKATAHLSAPPKAAEAAAIEAAPAPAPQAAVNILKAEASKPEAQNAPRPKAASPGPAKKEAKVPLRHAAPPGKQAEIAKEAHGVSSAVEAIMREVKEPEIQTKPVKARGDSRVGRTFKCPKCGKHVWAEGQLCNACGAEEYDSMRSRHDKS